MSINKLYLFVATLLIINCANFNHAQDGYNDKNVDCICLRWTEWIELGSPYDFQDLLPKSYFNLIQYGKVTAQANNIDVCTVPVSSHCRILVPNLQPEIKLNGEFAACPFVVDRSVGTDGLLQLRLLCWDGSCPCLEWSQWFNYDKPNDEGDIEILLQTIPKTDWPCSRGTQPLDVECRIASGEARPESNDKFLHCDLDGFRCLNDLQGDNCNCDDYMVRFLCLKTHLYKPSKDLDTSNCSTSKCRNETPLGRAGSTDQFSQEIPTSPKTIYGYGNCFVPLSCPRKDLSKMSRAFLSERTRTEELLQFRFQAQDRVIDCRRYPYSRECTRRHLRHSNLNGKNREDHITGNNPVNTSAVNHYNLVYPRTKINERSSADTWRSYSSVHGDQWNANDENDGESFRNRGSEWKPPPSYFQPHYPYNYPLMSSYRHQDVGPPSRQLSKRDDDRRHRKTKD